MFLDVVLHDSEMILLSIDHENIILGYRIKGGGTMP